jgi:acetyl-CoA C-acetyltransferase
MGDAWIVSTARTAIGTAYKGSLKDVDPIDLATPVVAAAVERSGLEPGLGRRRRRERVPHGRRRHR